ncbi:MAG: hypothetical protein WCP20_15895 [Desulfuromonadales bacterium]
MNRIHTFGYDFCGVILSILFIPVNKRFPVFCLAVSLLFTKQAAATDVSVKGWVVPEYHTINTASPFALGAGQSGFGKSRTREELELRARAWDVNLVATAATTATEQSKPEYAVTINELNYDISLLGERFSFGKKIVSWDVGFGFRPLDLLQQENRRTIFVTTLEGIPYLSWEKFSGNSAWMLIYTNPGHGMGGVAKNDESVALKYYLRDGTADWHVVVRLSERHHVEGGAAISTVPLESLEVHASLLYQQRYEQKYNSLVGSGGIPLSSSDPMRLYIREHGVKALAGFTLTGESGFSLLGEAWYDASAYSAEEWRDLKALAARQAALPRQGAPVVAVAGNIAYNLRYFDRPNLLKENLLLRLSHHREGENWEPALDILCTPADGGLVATASIAYSGNHFRVDSGIRQYGGARGSAYKMLPEERIIYFALQGFW